MQLCSVLRPYTNISLNIEKKLFKHFSKIPVIISFAMAPTSRLIWMVTLTLLIL